MEKVDIFYNEVEKAITVMKEVAKWGRETLNIGKIHPMCELCIYISCV